MEEEERGERGQSSPIEEKGGTVEHWLPMRWGRGGGGMGISQNPMWG